MSMARRVALCLIVLGMVAAFTPHGLRAMQATPVAYSQEVRDGFVDGAQRRFQATGMRLLGSNVFVTGVYVFNSEDVARLAFGEIVDTILLRIEESEAIGEVGEIRPASVSNLGEESQAYLTKTDMDGTELALGVVFWRDGVAVYTGISASLGGGDPFTELFALARAITGREYVDAPVEWSGDEGDIRSGGVWDLLPTLSDIPEGFVFVDEEEIANVGAAAPTP